MGSQCVDEEDEELLPESKAGVPGIFSHPNLFDSASKIFLSATITKLFSYTNSNWSMKCSTLHMLVLARSLNQTSYKPVSATRRLI